MLMYSGLLDSATSETSNADQSLMEWKWSGKNSTNDSGLMSVDPPIRRAVGTPSCRRRPS
jgi:hypothetical protein